jgi:hypothetical protein
MSSWRKITVRLDYSVEMVFSIRDVILSINILYPPRWRCPRPRNSQRTQWWTAASFSFVDTNALILSPFIVVTDSHCLPLLPQSLPLFGYFFYHRLLKKDMSQVCPHCDCDPCLWEEFGEGIIGEGKMFAAINQSRPRNEIHKQAYRVVCIWSYDMWNKEDN